MYKLQMVIVDVSAHGEVFLNLVDTKVIPS
jgi:hypothetical protein